MVDKLLLLGEWLEGWGVDKIWGGARGRDCIDVGGACTEVGGACCMLELSSGCRTLCNSERSSIACKAVDSKGSLESPSKSFKLSSPSGLEIVVKAVSRVMLLLLESPLMGTGVNMAEDW